MKALLAQREQIEALLEALGPDYIVVPGDALTNLGQFCLKRRLVEPYRTLAALRGESEWGRLSGWVSMREVIDLAEFKLRQEHYEREMATKPKAEVSMWRVPLPAPSSGRGLSLLEDRDVLPGPPGEEPR